MSSPFRLKRKKKKKKKKRSVPGKGREVRDGVSATLSRRQESARRVTPGCLLEQLEVVCRMAGELISPVGDYPNCSPIHRRSPVVYRVTS